MKKTETYLFRKFPYLFVALFKYLPLLIGIICIILFRKPDVITNPQFWAEDGSSWFADSYNMGIFPPFILTHTDISKHIQD
jgi:hypothetical protein